jgi:hypothetical protein
MPKQVKSPNTKKEPKYRKAWVAYCQYPGKAEFLLGTVFTDPKPTDKELYDEFQKLWEEISPYPMPPLNKTIPGMLFLLEQDDD